jgi:hypothetical protein
MQVSVVKLRKTALPLHALNFETGRFPAPDYGHEKPGAAQSPPKGTHTTGAVRPTKAGNLRIETAHGIPVLVVGDALNDLERPQLPSAGVEGFDHARRLLIAARLKCAEIVLRF